MNDDILILYFYDDGLSPEERKDVARALQSDSALAGRYRRLCDELSGLREPAEDPLSADLAARLHDTIERAANLERGRSPKPPMQFASFFWGAAVTAALAVGIGIGVWFGGESGPDGSAQPGMIAETSASPDAFVRSVQVHFRDSRAGLADLSSVSAADRMILVASLIEQNRLYARAAEQNDADDLARVLRAFEPILVDLAAEDIAPTEAEALRAQLAFELDVMLTKLTREPSDGTDSI